MTVLFYRWPYFLRAVSILNPGRPAASILCVFLISSSILPFRLDLTCVIGATSSHSLIRSVMLTILRLWLTLAAVVLNTYTEASLPDVNLGFGKHMKAQRLARPYSLLPNRD